MGLVPLVLKVERFSYVWGDRRFEGCTRRDRYIAERLQSRVL